MGIGVSHKTNPPPFQLYHETPWMTCSEMTKKHTDTGSCHYCIDENIRPKYDITCDIAAGDLHSSREFYSGRHNDNGQFRVQQ